MPCRALEITLGRLGLWFDPAPASTAVLPEALGLPAACLCERFSIWAGPGTRQLSVRAARENLAYSVRLARRCVVVTTMDTLGATSARSVAGPAQS